MNSQCMIAELLWLVVVVVQFCLLVLIHLYLKDNAPHCKKGFNIVQSFFLLSYSLFFVVKHKSFYLYFCSGLLLHFSSLSLCFGRWFFVCCMRIIMFLKYVKHNKKKREMRKKRSLLCCCIST